MLARYLNANARTPIRYGSMDTPQGVSHDEAVRNFLLVSARAFGLPQAHRQATPLLNQTAGKHAPALHAMLGDIIHGQEAGALAPFLDLHQDATGMQYKPAEEEIHIVGQDPHQDILQAVHAMHGALTGQFRGFNPQNWGVPHLLSNAMRQQVIGPPVAVSGRDVPHLSHMLRMLAPRPRGGKPAGNTFATRRPAFEHSLDNGDYRAWAHAHDLLNHLHTSGNSTLAGQLLPDIQHGLARLRAHAGYPELFPEGT